MQPHYNATLFAGLMIVTLGLDGCGRPSLQTRPYDASNAGAQQDIKSGNASPSTTLVKTGPSTPPPGPGAIRFICTTSLERARQQEGTTIDLDYSHNAAIIHVPPGIPNIKVTVTRVTSKPGQEIFSADYHFRNPYGAEGDRHFSINRTTLAFADSGPTTDGMFTMNHPGSCVRQ